MTSILIADIGGTHARFAIADETGIHDPQVFHVADYPGPDTAALAYLKGRDQKLDRAVFALAGPVMGDHFELTNFPWAFSVAAVSKTLGCNLTLINDFHATALGVIDADPETILQIGGGTRVPQSNIGIIGPGTGLGVASLIWDDVTKKYVAVPCEGGHVTIPTVNAREHAIVDWLLAHKYTHVSAERVCSGKGLLNLYDAICGIDRLTLPDRTPEEISAAGLAHQCPTCQECLTLMIGFLGRVAGNLALTNATLGGIYFSGGILPHLGMSYLQSSRLRGEFIAKGRQTSYVDRIPTFLIDDPFLALKGLRNYGLGDGNPDSHS